MVYRVWFTRVWSLSLNSGYGLPGYGRCGIICEVPTPSDNGRGNQKRGDASTDKVRGDASTDKVRGTPAQTRRGADKDKEQGRGRKFFCMEFPPLVVPPDGGKPMQKTPPLCSLSLSALSPSLPVLT